ncbi:hypothetical protein DOY81_012551 [Sarcophaga bullata]|nr:hypothetical protein DOY81_012551 [Sarcophaga bullata]
MPTVHTLSNSTFYDGSELSQRSLTLPRRHRRNLSSESTFLISSRDCSPIRRRSPVYSSSSLPRSTQSIPASTNPNTNGCTTTTITKNNQSSATLSVRTSTPYRSSQKSIQSGSVARHLLEHSPSRSVNSSQKSSNSTGRNQDTRRRMWQSGPSSIESGKTSLYTSGPSSIDSGKVSYNRTSGHSSLDSQRSTSSTVIQPRSIIMLNGSPRGTPRHQVLRARNAEQIMRNQSSSTNTTSNSSFQLPTDEHHQTNSRDASSNSENIENNPTISNSTSNNSITLKLTTVQ